MKLQFLGANRQVTGSRHYLEAGGLRLVVDCGMFQERAYLDRNWEPCPVSPRRLDAVILTHAHVDHCGLLPRLVAEGFRGRVYATSASVDLVDLVLRDAAEIQVEDAAYKRKRHRQEGRRGKHPEIPLFTVRDVDRAMPLVQAVRYGRPVQLNSRTRLSFHDAGHILGSASVQIDVADGAAPTRIVFSGDIGQWGKPILRDPTVFEEADYVVMESTYGDRQHNHGGRIEEQLAEAINGAVAAGGNVVIPTFAIERAQELIYYMARLERAGQIPRVPTYLDSPLAAEATGIFQQHRECYDEEMMRLIESGQAPLDFPGLRIVRTVAESKAINRLDQPAVIMAPSGMCSAGRIKHHLAHNITRPECTILFTGFQVGGTLGREILNGNPEVRIHGRQWPVRARIAQVQGFSGHADRTGLLRWLQGFRKPPRRLFLTHGEEESSLAFAETVQKQPGWNVSVPRFLEEAELDA